MTNRERYLGNSTKRQHLLQWTLAVRAQLPKKYWDKFLALCKQHPEVSETHQLTLSSLELRILWRCPVVELPRLLHLMTRGSRGTMTSEILPGHSGVGHTIQLTFTVPAGLQGGHSDARES